MTWLLDRIFGVSWPQLIAIQRTFSSKALTAIPIIAFAVTALAKIDIAGIIIGNWKLHVVFWGAIIFLLGQFIAWKRRPIEFATHLDTEGAMAGIVNLSNISTFKSRYQTLKSTVEAFRPNPPRGLSRNDFNLAASRVAAPIEDVENEWQANLPIIVTSQRRLSAFEYPLSRAFSVVFLFFGILLMTSPAVFNVATTLVTLLQMYGSWLLHTVRCG